MSNEGREQIAVASFTDAWIETWQTALTTGIMLVASFTDAWIETSGGRHRTFPSGSHLLQMRGLKHVRHRCREI